MPPHPDPEPPDAWLEDFHAGQRACLEACYREHFDTVDRAVGAILAGADRETVVHEIFFRVLTDHSLRRSFGGGSLAAWLRVVSRNRAIDHARRRRREVSLPGNGDDLGQPDQPALEERTNVRLTLERFRTRVLPKKWEPVFIARFVELQDQPTAARALGMSRTTLVYHEFRIRKLLRQFILRGERP
jgi:RNA polymerase sigma-70 factor (ECF subfamily)